MTISLPQDERLVMVMWIGKMEWSFTGDCSIAKEIMSFFLFGLSVGS